MQHCVRMRLVRKKTMILKVGLTAVNRYFLWLKSYVWGQIMNVSFSRLGRSLLDRTQMRSDTMPLMPSLRRRRLQCYLAMMIGDIASVFAGFSAAGYLYQGQIGLQSSLLLAQMLIPLFLTVALYSGAYSIEPLRKTNQSISRVNLALFISAAAVVFIAFYTKSSQDFSRLGFTLGVFSSGVILTWMRLQMRGFIRWRCGAVVYNELIIDDGGPKVMLAGAYHVSARAFALKPVLDDPHVLDRIGLMMRNADRVIISSPPARRADWAIILKGSNVEGEVLDDTVEALSALGARRAGGHGLLRVSAGPLGLRDQVTKRLFDLVIAGGALLIFAPLLLVVALLIKLEDGGPVFFVQRRVGRSNRFFAIWKFRSMAVNRLGQDGDKSTARDDERVTRIGQIIRKTSIDELPQLFNVLRGDMSLVGPRPHAIGSHAGEKLFWEVDARYWVRHALKPGLTGLAQIRGLRGATDSEEDLAGRLNADLEYLVGWTLWRDIWIILSTFKVLVHDQAY
jgi:polysaccharide biosynthesis protein PslA